MLKRAEVIAVTEKISVKLARNLNMFARFSKGIIFKFLIERRHRFSQEKFYRKTEHVTYSIRYCRILLLVYSGSSEPFLTHSICINCY